MRRLAALDIGSNTVHALVADWDGKELEDVASHVEIPRLGAVVARTGEVGRARSRILAAVRRVGAAARADGGADLVAGATEAVRRARDAGDLLAAAGAELGVPVRLISAEREARLSFLGAAHRHAVDADWLLADVGGGSTELVAARGRELRAWASLPIGSGDLAARYLSDPPRPGERERLREAAVAALDGAPESEGQRLVVTGGTAATLPGLLGRPAGTELGVQALLEAQRRVDAGAAGQIARRLRLPAARVLALRGGVEILLLLLDWAGLDRLLPTHEGVRHGMLLAYLERGDDWWR